MNVLVTGGCGFLGHHLVEHLLKYTGHDIIVLDKLTYASNGFDRLRDIQAFDDKRVRVLGCDLSQPIPAGIAHEVGDIDIVIHAAAETHVDNSISDPLPFLQSNVIGTHHLLWWLHGHPMAMFQRPGAAFHDLKHIFIISTDEVYGPAEFGQDVQGFNEEARFRPANPYAAAKAGGEAVAMAYANTYKLPITIVNTMNLVGERQHHEKFVPLVIRSVLQDETVRIHADPTRTISGTRFYLHCRTLAHALHFLMARTELPLPRKLPLKVHVCGEREISNLELAQFIASVVGKPLKYELVDFHSSRPGHDLRYAMDDSMIVNMGWQRPMLLEQSLKKTIEWYLAHPKWLGLDA